MLTLETAEARDIKSLQNWLNGTGCIAREETAYLTHSREMASLAPLRDNALMKVEIWVENVLVRFYSGFRKVRNNYLVSEQADEDPRIITTISRSTRTCTCIPVA